MGNMFVWVTLTKASDREKYSHDLEGAVWCVDELELSDIASRDIVDR